MWKHPVEKPLDFVVFVAMGPSKAQWIQNQISMNPDITPDQIWTLNSGMAWVGGADLIFYMDDLSSQVQDYPGTHEKLKQCKLPVITSMFYEIEGVTCPILQYPLKEVLEHVGPANDYFVNSVPYVIAYALMTGVKRLLMFGVDYEYPGIGIKEEGRACCEFWCGYAIARGMTVQVSDGSTLLNANKGRPFYGYLRQPRIVVVREEEEEKT